MASTSTEQWREAEAWRALLTTPRSYRGLLLAVATFAIMAFSAAVLLVVAAITLFRARRLYSEVLARWTARMILHLWGVRVVVHQDKPFPRTQTVYISNHTSTLDVVLLTGLGLPSTRFFLSGFLRKLLPLGVISTLMGTFHTPLQTDRPARVRCFQRAERFLRKTGESVYLSPEGQRITTGRIGHFNKGAFHLATNLRVPIVPLYIDVPPEADPGLGYEARAGTVHVYVLSPIRTDHWRLEDLERNKEMVRERFVEFQRTLRGAMDA